MVVDAIERTAAFDRRVVFSDALPDRFTCSSCGESYDDGPPLVTVRSPDRPLMEFCTDRCTESAGFVDVVLARRIAEARGDAICIIYLAY
jgi:hypothetical protein